VRQRQERSRPATASGGQCWSSRPSRPAEPAGRANWPVRRLVHSSRLLRGNVRHPHICAPGTEEKLTLRRLREGAPGGPKLAPVPKLPSPLLTTIGLAGGFAVARATKNRPLGGVVWATSGLLCIPAWRKAGLWPGLLLGATYAGALGGSHPLAKRVGAWPSVAIVSASMAALGWALSERSS
jgi:hypothetical protein